MFCHFERNIVKSGNLDDFRNSCRIPSLRGHEAIFLLIYIFSITVLRLAPSPLGRAGEGTI